MSRIRQQYMNHSAEDKRKRSPNWLTYEKMLLVNLVRKHYSVLEIKGIDSSTLRKKAEEWQTLAHEYNSQTTHLKRTPENLKLQWETLKKTTKKEAGRMGHIRPDGMHLKLITDDAVLEKVFTMIGPALYGCYNPFDSDTELYSSTVEVEEVIQMTEEPTQSDEVEVMIKVEPEEIVSTQEKDVTHLPYPVISIEPLQVQSFEPDIYHLNGEESNNKSLKSQKTKIEPLQSSQPDIGHHTHHNVVENNNKPLTSQKPKLMRQNLNNLTVSRHPISTKMSSSKELHRRKMIYLRKELYCLTKEREEANARHAMEMEIKREQLKQERIKTRLLLLELRKKRKEKS